MPHNTVESKFAIKRFTLIELLVVVSIISVLAAILLPVLGKARGMAMETNCQSNVKQIGVAVMLYEDDFEEWLPVAHGGYPLPNQNLSYKSGVAYDLRDYVSGYPVLTGTIFDCPTLENPGPAALVEYGWNSYYLGGYAEGSASGWSERVKANIAKQPEITIALAERDDGSSNNHGEWKRVSFKYYNMRHRNMLNSNMLWLDGHVSSEKWYTYYYPNAETYTSPLRIHWNPAVQ